MEEGERDNSGLVVGFAVTSGRFRQRPHANRGRESELQEVTVGGQPPAPLRRPPRLPYGSGPFHGPKSSPRSPRRSRAPSVRTRHPAPPLPPPPHSMPGGRPTPPRPQ